MDARLALVPDNSDTSLGVIKPIAYDDGNILYGMAIGHWTSHTSDGNIHIVLYDDITTIIHEKATGKAIRAELRAAEKDNNGEEIRPDIEYDPKTKRFKEVWPVKEK